MPSEADKRQVAVDAERFWWTTRLDALRDQVGRAGAQAEARRLDPEAAHDLLDAATLLDALIRQRTT